MSLITLENLQTFANLLKTNYVDLKSFNNINSVRALDIDVDGNEVYAGGVMTIVDDDGHTDFETKGFADVYRNHGVYPTLAIVACRAETPTGITTSGDPYTAFSWDQLTALANEGFEIQNHSYSHNRAVFPNGSGATAAQFDFEYREAQRLFHAHGFQTDTIIYPWGHPSAVGIYEATKYFKYGLSLGGTGIISESNFKPYEMTRYSQASSSNIAGWKSAMLECLDNHNWLIACTHANALTPNATALDEILTYAEEIGLRVETFTKAARLKAPAIRIGSGVNMFSVYPSGIISDNTVKQIITKAYSLNLIGKTIPVPLSLEAIYSGGSQVIGTTFNSDALVIKKVMSDNSRITVSDYSYTNGSAPTIVAGNNEIGITYTEDEISLSTTFSLQGVDAIIQATDFDITPIEIGLEEKTQLEIIYTPNNATSNLGITWSSDCGHVEIVDGEASLMIMCSESGEHSLTGVLENGTSHTWTITVAPNLATGFGVKSPIQGSMAYFDTEYLPTQNTRVETLVKQLGKGSFFGRRDADGSSNAFYYYNNVASINTNFARFGNVSVGGQLNSITAHTIKMDSSGLYIDDVLQKAFNYEGQITSTSSMSIFNIDTGGDHGTSGRFCVNTILYTFKIYEGDVLIHDYLPARYKEYATEVSYTPVLYDTVDKVYLHPYDENHRFTLESIE